MRAVVVLDDGLCFDRTRSYTSRVVEDMLALVCAMDRRIAATGDCVLLVRRTFKANGVLSVSQPTLDGCWQKVMLLPILVSLIAGEFFYFYFF